ncbi:MAG: DUF2846 domain-containing protein [Terriglobia bacterium]|jgi:hypothetical protein
MRTALIIFLMASAVLAQAQTGETRLAPSCGPDEVAFEVKTDKRSHPMGQAVAGKALVYFFEHDWYRGYSRPTTRLGVDGGWVGATSGNSYFYFSVDPGEHHICASWQIGVGAGRSRQVAAAHFKAEAGVVYYFKAESTPSRGEGITSGISLHPVDSDKGQLLPSKYSFSTFQQRK